MYTSDERPSVKEFFQNFSVSKRPPMLAAIRMTLVLREPETRAVTGTFVYDCSSKIDAIKRLRLLMDCGLIESKALIEYVESERVTCETTLGDGTTRLIIEPKPEV